MRTEEEKGREEKGKIEERKREGIGGEIKEEMKDIAREEECKVSAYIRKLKTIEIVINRLLI